MRYDNPTNGIPRPAEVITAIRDLLAQQAWTALAFRYWNGSAWIDGDGSEVFAFRDPADKPAGGKWVRVAEKVTRGGRWVGSDGTSLLRIAIKTECGAQMRNADLWHEQVQTDIADTLLTSFNPTLTDTGNATGLRQTREASQPLATPDGQTLYTASEYEIVIAPKP